MNQIEKAVISLARGAFSVQRIRPTDRLADLATTVHGRVVFALALEDTLGITLTEADIHKLECADKTTIADVCNITKRHFRPKKGIDKHENDPKTGEKDG